MGIFPHPVRDTLNANLSTPFVRTANHAPGARVMAVPWSGRLRGSNTHSNRISEEKHVDGLSQFPGPLI
jgi:hypothetical protein